MNESGTSWEDLPQLAEHHIKDLVGSGITPEIAAARGYITIAPTELGVLSELKPTRYGRNSLYAGLLIPSHGVTGGIVGHQLKPDSEVIDQKTGDVRKYLSPYSEASVVDCPPTMLDKLRDDTVPLIITEGSKKADSAATRGYLCLALRGVDCWVSGRNTALEDWREIQMRGRQVAICYDSDIVEKPGVRAAAKKLARYLTRMRGANVSFIILPGHGDGRKRGLDDWLVDFPDGNPWDLAVGQLPDIDNFDPDKKQILATDLDVADEWVARNSDDFRFVRDVEQWRAYNSGRWDGDGGLHLARASFQLLVRDIHAYALKEKDNGEQARLDATPWLRNAGRIAAVLTQASANPTMQITSHEFDQDPYLFNVPNGTIDLRRATLLDHDPDHLISLQSLVAYDPLADAPEFEAFLRFVLPEEETRLFVQRLLGMALIGEVTEHIFPVFQGAGRNGKGTLLRLVQAIFGSYYSGISKSLLIQTRFEEHATIRATLYRKRLVTAQEVGREDAWDAESIKELTGGDDITGRYMRGDEFTFKPSHTLILAANHWPQVSAKDEAFWARVRKIPFTQVFAKPDSSIEARIRDNEGPGILNWLVEGCQAYLRDGLGEPAQVVAATAGIRAESDPLSNFLAEYVEITHDPVDEVAFRHLYDELYLSWCRTHRVAVSTMIARNKFGAEVAKATGLEPPKRGGHEKVSTFYGMQLIDGQGVTEGNHDPFGGDAASGAANGESGAANGGSPAEGSSWGGAGAAPLSGPAASLAAPLVDHASRETAGNDGSAASAASAASLCKGIDPRTEEACKAVNPAHQDDSFTASEGSSGDTQEESRRTRRKPPTPATTEGDGGLFDAPIDAPAEPIGYTAADLATWTAEADIELPDGVVVFDIESTSDRLWPARPDFIRITGVQQGRTIRVTADAAEVAELLRTTQLIVGHNILGFDLLAFAMHHGVDLHQLLAEDRVIDTMLTEVVVNPPEARTKQGEILRSVGLDALGAAKGLGSKSHDLAQLAKKWGGYDRIPVDDCDYVTYCAQDVNLTAKIAATQNRSAYAKREHRIAGIAAQMRLSGFRVDVDLLRERLAANEAERKRRVAELVERYGVPTMKKDGKPSKNPLATKEGKEAIRKAYDDLGVPLGTTPGGDPAFGKEAREELLETYGHREDVAELTDTVGALLGIRSVYGTVEQYRIGDRVHPNITMFQASGRWSITEPGLTVMGKRGGKHVERNIFLPEPGHVLISADLSQVDARAVAAWCQDPAYMELFEPGRDSHTEIAVAVWGDPGRRDDAKVLGHGWNYGMGVPKLAKKIGSEEVAREFDAKMKDQFPLLVAWKQEVAALADSGELLDNGFGRKLRTTRPRYIEAEERWTSPGWTQGPALMGQSAARDIMMDALLRMPLELYPYLRAVVHDEVVMSIPEDQADEIEAKVMAAMNFQWAPRPDYLPVRIEAGLAKRGRAWGQCYAK